MVYAILSVSVACEFLPLLMATFLLLFGLPQ